MTSAPTGHVGPARDVRSPRASKHTVLGTSALLCLASAVVTVHWSTSMTAMGGRAMPGGWTLSMAWRPMPGESWVAVSISRLGMWVAMMVAMMLPSVAPTLSRYHETVGQTVSRSAARRAGRLTWLAGAAYFVVWAGVGTVVIPVGVALAALVGRDAALARAAPVAAGVVVLVAGLLQFTTWKARQLAGCRPTSMACRSLAPDAAAAWRYGLHLGLRCSACSAGLAAALLVVGMMDLRLMGAAAVASAAERLAPRGEPAARAVGVALVIAGVVLLAQAGTR